MQVQTQQEPSRTENTLPTPAPAPTRTVVGWQGIRCLLPPDWNLTGLSMERDSGYLRIDAPSNSAMTVQIRWTNAAKPAQTNPNLYSFLQPHYRRWRKIPEPPVPKPDLKANLEKLLKDNSKQAKKGKVTFESSIKPEKTEGAGGERTAMNFTWTGAGRGQGKIWYCQTCHRIVVAQVVGGAKETSAMSAIASQLFASLQDHSDDGYDLWALYDLQAYVPEDFRLESQKLLSGHLHLEFGRGAERIVIDRWGLASITLKKFTLKEWFQAHALIKHKGLTESEFETPRGHTALRYEGAIPLFSRARILRESKGSLRRFPSRYAGGIWECPNSNKIYAVQILHNKRTEGLWEEVANRCVCH